MILIRPLLFTPSSHVSKALSASLAVSCVSGSSTLDSFRDGGCGRIVGALWGVEARTYSILLAM